ncbi:Endopolyphosphatase [Nowakowskiella sp. JEL0078]|nr:Endopolyphosphatase [Nowakowskiella sp. JEL0078]
MLCPKHISFYFDRALLYVVFCVLPFQVEALYISPFKLSNSTAFTTSFFLHLTDLHIVVSFVLTLWNLDSHYKEESLWIYNCHRKAEPSRSGDQFPLLTLPERRISGRFGSPTSGCDSPVILILETFRFIKNVLWGTGGNLDFVVWTGDSARHDNDPRIKRTHSEIIKYNKLAVKYLTATFSTKRKNSKVAIPIIPSVGNNDLFFHNKIAYNGSAIDNLVSLSEAWDGLIPYEQKAQFERSGWFFVNVGMSLKVVSLNTMYFYKSNSAVSDCNSPESAGSIQLVWLSSILKSSRKKSSFVYIIGHVPPTIFNYYPAYIVCYQEFAKISNTYTDVIRGQMYGHMNLDHFIFPTRRTKADEKVIKKLYSDRKIEPELKQKVELSEDKTVVTFNELDYLENELFSEESEDSEILSTIQEIESESDGVVSVMGTSFLKLYWKYLMYHYQSTLERYVGTSEIPVPVFVAPSVIPTYNPGIRVWSYDPVTASLKGYTQYFANLSHWNELSSKQLQRTLWRRINPSIHAHSLATLDDAIIKPIDFNEVGGENQGCDPIPTSNETHSDTPCQSQYLFEKEYVPNIDYLFPKKWKNSADVIEARTKKVWTWQEVWLQFGNRLARLGKVKSKEQGVSSTTWVKLRRLVALNMVVRAKITRFWDELGGDVL